MMIKMEYLSKTGHDFMGFKIEFGSVLAHVREKDQDIARGLSIGLEDLARKRQHFQYVGVREIGTEMCSPRLPGSN